MLKPCLALAFAAFLPACSHLAGASAVPVPTPTPVALVGLTQAAQALEGARQSYDVGALTTAALSLSACAGSGEQPRDCATLGTQAAWLLSCVQEGLGKKEDALASAALASDLAETAVKGLTPTAETRALLADAYIRRAWLSDMADATKYGALAALELSKVVSPTAQPVYVQQVLGRRRYYLPTVMGGDVDKAAEAFKALQALAPSDLNLYYLGLAYAQQGQKKKARASLEEALALDPSNVMARRALDRL